MDNINQKVNLKPSVINLYNREKMELTGIKEVISSTDKEIIARVDNSIITIQGKELRVVKLMPEDEFLSISGMIDLFKYDGIELTNHFDCGENIFARDKKFFCGGSGCACIGLLSFSYIKNMMKKGVYKKVLLVGTGSLHSVTSVNLKLPIPSIAHAISLEVKY
jgi:hypothetical protein